MANMRSLEKASVAPFHAPSSNGSLNTSRSMSTVAMFGRVQRRRNQGVPQCNQDLSSMGLVDLVRFTNSFGRCISGRSQKGSMFIIVARTSCVYESSVSSCWSMVITQLIMRQQIQKLVVDVRGMPCTSVGMNIGKSRIQHASSVVRRPACGAR